MKPRRSNAGRIRERRPPLRAHRLIGHTDNRIEIAIREKVTDSEAVRLEQNAASPESWE